MNQFPNLKELRISGNDLSRMIPLSGGRQLQAFVSKSTHMASVRALGTKTILSNLRALDLSQNPITSISALAGAYLLKGLWLSECQLNNYGQVMKVLKKLKFLEVLDLRYCMTALNVGIIPFSSLYTHLMLILQLRMGLQIALRCLLDRGLVE
jgi:Leucine-rich repeat (LRR) protein